LSSLNAAELFFEEHEEDGAAEEAIHKAFDAAEPALAARGGEVGLLVVPPGPAGLEFLDVVRRVLADVPLIHVVGGDDILFYREAAQVAFDKLAQLGPAARAAYDQLKRREHFTPHSRTDIVFV